MTNRIDTTSDGTFRIASPRLQVDLAWPGSELQKGARFSLSGHVTQVTLDGCHRFCAPESPDERRGSGGLGLCNEFIDVSRDMYNGAGPGEPFAKMGVGLVTRSGAGEYSFMEHYAKVPFPVEVSCGEDAVEFTVQPIEMNGYASSLSQRLSVSDNTLTVEYRMRNTGSKPFELLEYNHNFVCIDGNTVGPDYRLTFPYGIGLDKVPEVLSLNKYTFTWKRTPTEPFFCLPGGFESVTPHSWELVHGPSGVGMRETDIFPVDHVAVWGTGSVVSTEVFIRIALKPGEEMKWARKYEFFD